LTSYRSCTAFLLATSQIRAGKESVGMMPTAPCLMRSMMGSRRQRSEASGEMVIMSVLDDTFFPAYFSLLDDLVVILACMDIVRGVDKLLERCFMTFRKMYDDLQNPGELSHIECILDCLCGRIMFKCVTIFLNRQGLMVCRRGIHLKKGPSFFPPNLPTSHQLFLPDHTKWVRIFYRKHQV